MIRVACVWLALAGLCLWTQAADPSPGQALTSDTETSRTHQTNTESASADTNSAALIPQLSANPATESEMQARRIVAPATSTNVALPPVKRTVPKIENITFFVLGGMIAFLVIVGVAGRRSK